MIVLVEAIILGVSITQEDKPKATALITAPKKQLKKKIKCDRMFTITAKMNETHYQESYNNIPDPDRMIFDVSNYSLNVNKKRLKRLPNELLTARCIKNIYLRKNFLREFPTQLLEQPFLETLDLSDNEIYTFPNIKKPTSIKRLSLSGNDIIKEIPSSIQFFTNLESLYLHNMQSLEKIHDNIQYLKKLKKLVIKYTPLARDHYKVFILKGLLPNTEIILTKNKNKKR